MPSQQYQIANTKYSVWLIKQDRSIQIRRIIFQELNKNSKQILKVMNVKVELKNGYFKSNLCLKDRLIDTVYKEFISKDFSYKKTYLQKKYNYGFDGYSYLGQKDSSNQQI